jgi:hypothetical protein
VVTNSVFRSGRNSAFLYDLRNISRNVGQRTTLASAHLRQADITQRTVCAAFRLNGRRCHPRPLEFVKTGRKSLCLVAKTGIESDIHSAARLPVEQRTLQDTAI